MESCVCANLFLCAYDNAPTSAFLVIIIIMVNIIIIIIIMITILYKGEDIAISPVYLSVSVCVCETEQVVDGFGWSFHGGHPMTQGLSDKSSMVPKLIFSDL